MATLGVDVAYVDHNDTIGWSAFYNTGGRFAYLRAAYSTTPDPVWRREAGRAHAAGIIVGPYFFPNENIDGPSLDAQIGAFATTIIGFTGPGFLPAAFDVEYPKGIKGTGRTRKELLLLNLQVKAKLKEILGGVSPVMYSSARVIDGEDSDSLDADASGVDISPLWDSPFWCAKYITGYRKSPIGDTPAERDALDKLEWPPLPKYLGDKTNVWIRQTQGDSIGLPGFSSTADINIFYSLRIGDKGERVKWAQQRLGMVEGTPGVFDSVMYRAVIDFQKLWGLKPDGVIGPTTFSFLAWIYPRE